MSIVKTRSKSVLFVLLLTLMVSQVVHAQRNLYRSDSGGPFMRMMLTMMDAMGMIDKVPNNSLYGGYGNNLSSPWSNNSNPYTRALALRGIYPGASSLYNNPYSNNPLGNNPFARSPWLQTPWLDSGEYGQYGSPYASPLWGTPDWGVLPAKKNSPYGYSSYGEQWSDSDLEGWVDEPWETSEWNPKAEKSEAPVQAQSYQQPQASQRTQSPQPNVPVVQNFNITVPENTQLNGNQGNRPDNRQGNRYDNEYNRGYPDVASNRSPLSRLTQQGPSAQRSNRPSPAQQRKPSPLRKRTMQPPGPQQYQPGQYQPDHYQAGQQQQWESQHQGGQPSSSSQQSRSQPQQPGSQQPRNQVREKPCITEFCGLKKPNLNGLWVAENGEMLGISGQKFLWGDAEERYLTGLIKIQNEYLLASVEGSERLMRFKYKLAGDHLLTMQPNGTIREFIRTTPGELYGGYYSGY